MSASYVHDGASRIVTARDDRAWRLAVTRWLAAALIALACLAALAFADTAPAATTALPTASYSYHQHALNARVARANAHATPGLSATRPAQEPAKRPTGTRFLAADEGTAGVLRAG